MNRMTTLSDELERIEFAKRAAKHFAEKPEHWSFGDMKPGDFLALRWGLGDDCVLILKLDPDFQPVNFQQLIREYR